MSTPGWGKWFFSSIHLWYGHLEFCVPCRAPQGKEEVNPRALWWIDLRLVRLRTSRELLSLLGLSSLKQSRIKVGRRTQLQSLGSWWMVIEKAEPNHFPEGQRKSERKWGHAAAGKILARLNGKKCSVERGQPEHQRGGEIPSLEMFRAPLEKALSRGQPWSEQQVRWDGI